MLAAGLLAKKAVERGLDQAVGEDHPGAGLEGGDRVLQEAGLTPLPREAALPPGRLRLHHLHRQLRTAAGGGVRAHQGKRPGGGRGAERQPQLRRAHQLRGARQLPGVAAAGGGLRAGRTHRHRPANEPLGATSRASRSSCGTSGRPKEVEEAIAKCVGSGMFAEYADVFNGDEHWQSLAVPEGDTFAWDAVHLHQEPAVLRRHGAEPAGGDRHHRRARAGGAGRHRHHRPHFAGRLDQGGQPGGQVPDRARRGAEGLQLLRRAARQSRGHGARHLRQHPPAEQAGARDRGRLHASPARRRGDVHLRRGDAVQAREECR